MLLSIVYRLVRCLFGLLAVLARSDLSKDAAAGGPRSSRSPAATILRWHRGLVARTWDYASRRRPGRPSTGTSVKALAVRMARENPAWGHRI